MTLSQLLKEKLAFDETTVAIDAGFHAGDIKQLHATECPALLEFANLIVKAEHGRLSPILNQLLACVEAIKQSIARSDDYGDSHCSQPIRQALANLRKELEK